MAPATPTKAAAAAPSSSSSAFVAQDRTAGIPASSKILTTPAVRKIAKENNVNLSLVAPTGPKGRIIKEDVLRFIQGKQAPQKAGPVATHSAPHTPGPVSNAPVPSGVVPLDQRVPIRGIQRMMVKSMTESLQVNSLTGMSFFIAKPYYHRSRIAFCAWFYSVLILFLPPHFFTSFL